MKHILKIHVVFELLRIIIEYDDGSLREITFDQLYITMTVFANQFGVTANDLNQVGELYTYNETDYFSIQIFHFEG